MTTISAPARVAKIVRERVHAHGRLTTLMDLRVALPREAGFHEMTSAPDAAAWLRKVGEIETTRMSYRYAATMVEWLDTYLDLDPAAPHPMRGVTPAMTVGAVFFAQVLRAPDFVAPDMRHAFLTFLAASDTVDYQQPLSDGAMRTRAPIFPHQSLLRQIENQLLVVDQMSAHAYPTHWHTAQREPWVVWSQWWQDFHYFPRTPDRAADAGFLNVENIASDFASFQAQKNNFQQHWLPTTMSNRRAERPYLQRFARNFFHHHTRLMQLIGTYYERHRQRSAAKSDEERAQIVTPEAPNLARTLQRLGIPEYVAHLPTGRAPTEDDEFTILQYAAFRRIVATSRDIWPMDVNPDKLHSFFQ